MEIIRKQDLGEAGEELPASMPKLEQKHDEIDILDGCPREFTAGGVKCVSRAFKGKEFTQLLNILLFFGFGPCDSIEEIDGISVDRLYMNAVFNSPFYLDRLGFDSIESWLYSLMEFPKGVEPPPFESVETEEFVRFFAILFEQNNIIEEARRHAKKNLKVLKEKTNL